MSNDKITSGFEVSQNQSYRDASKSIKNIYDAAIEMVTNSVDSYYALDKSWGKVEIIYDQKNRVMTFIDNGTGMSHQKLDDSFTKIGQHSAVGDGRGMHSKGAKDCRVVGKVEVHTFKDNRYSKVICTDDINNGLTRWKSDFEATSNLRKKYEIKNNGTCVIVTNSEKNKKKFPFANFDGFVSRLKNRFELSGIIKKESIKNGSKVICINAQNKSDKVLLEYKEPIDSEIIEDYEFEIKKYAFKARFILKKSKNPVTRDIIIMSDDRSAHEESRLAPEFTRNLYLDNYYGFLICPGINKLAREYIKNPDSDEHEIIDSNRRNGLDRDHPFVKELLSKPINSLKAAIKKEDEKQKTESSKQTQQVKTLIKEAKQFLANIIKESGPDPIGPDPKYLKGIRFFPSTGKSLLTEKKKKFTLWVNKDYISNKSNPTLQINTNKLDSYLETDDEVVLTQHSEYPNIYQGSFTVETGTEEAEGMLTFLELDKVKSNLATKISKIDSRDFENDLEFESTIYRVYGKLVKKIKIYARSPEIVDGRSLINFSVNNKNIKLISDSKVKISSRPRANYASAEIEIKSLHLNQRSTLTAELNGKTTSCEIETHEEQNSGPNIEWTDKNMGGERYVWKEETNTLLLNSNFMLNRRLYDPDKTEQSKAWLVMYVDLLTDAFAEKVLDYISNKFPDKLDITESDDKYMLITDVMNKHSIERARIYEKLIDKYIK